MTASDPKSLDYRFPDPQELSERWRLYRSDHPKVRIRDAAKALGVAEAQLLATKCGDDTTRLAGDWRELLKALQGVGPVMTLTRNEYAVHEKKGEYKEVGFDGMVGLSLGEIDLRLFMSCWKKGFSVEEETDRGIRRSFQFFDETGTAIHKVYLQKESDHDLFEKLRDESRSENQSTVEDIDSPAEKESLASAEEIDREELRRDWEGMADTHEFHRLLGKHRAGRTTAFELVGRDLATPVDPLRSHRYVLELAGETQTPIMVFVGNRGCIQIHSGPVERLVPLGSWYNVLDRTFNLHLNETGIEQAWVVRKPTSDGIVTSLELFDASGEIILQIFGSRKETITENPVWRGIIEGLIEFGKEQKVTRDVGAGYG